MNTNEQAQKVIELLHSLLGHLVTASKDGKVEVKELIAMVLKLIPMVMIILAMTNEDSSGN